MYFLQQPATCTKCGHQRPSNGTNDDGSSRIGRYIVCPKCFEAMLAQFCGYMKPDDWPDLNAPTSPPPQKPE